MPATIRYHAHCMDGIVSAALASRAWKVRKFLPYAHTHPGAEPEIVEGAIGVDIPFIPGMRRWIDHHASGMKFFTVDRLRRYGRPIDCTVTYDPTAPACVTLLPAPPGFRALIAAVTRIDSGTYARPTDAIDLSNDVLRITATVNRLQDAAVDGAMIQQLIRPAAGRRDPIPDLLRMLPVGAAEETIQLQEDHRELFRRHSRVREHILSCDLTTVGERAAGISQFVAYALFPETAVSLVLTATDHATTVFLGRNPWHPKPTPDLSAIAVAHGGGGHPNAAGITFGATPMERVRARRTFDAILRSLRRRPAA